ncbi:WG repeat-containing protein [Longispora sp. NPDC051575]|uniref:WG repeat-containing protein n=1 Tax=Longispora sp. NPDC051575 TaxID=3154943 RepID=UPI00341DB9B2
MPPYVLLVPTPDGERSALLDRAGRLLRAPDLLTVWAYDEDGAGNWTAVAQALDGRWGYLDAAGRWLVEPTLLAAQRMSPDGLARFRAESGWGFVDRTGRVVVEPVHDAVGGFYEGLASVEDGGRVRFVDTTGATAIEGPFAQVGAFSGGLASARWVPDGPIGFVDRSGATVIGPTFDRVRPFSADGAAAPARTGKYWGLIDRSGGWLIEPRFPTLNAFNEDGLAYFAEPYPKSSNPQPQGYLDSAGKVVATGDRHLAEEMACGLARTSPLPGLGFVGRSAIKGPFTWATDFHRSGAAIVLRGDEWGVLRADGEYLPSGMREPASDWDGMVIGYGHGQGIAPFLSWDASWVYLDTHARPVARYEVADGRARLTGPDGGELWASGPDGGEFRRLTPDLALGPEEMRDSREDVVAAAERMLAAEPVPYRPCSLVFGGWRDPMDLDFHPDYDDGDEVTWLGGIVVLASDHVNDEASSTYPFLEDQYEEVFRGLFADWDRRLVERFGPPTGEYAPLACGLPDGCRVWTFDAGKLVLEWHRDTGDGNFENQIWLAWVTGTEPSRSGGEE